MMGKSTIPWPPVLLALATAVAMLVAGASFWLIAGMLTIWIGSLWLIRSEPPHHDGSERSGSSSRDVVAEAIDPIGLPLVLFDRERIAAANAAARKALGAHVVGQDARIALRHPEAIRLLDLEDGASVSVPGLTGARSLWQLTRQRINARYWLLELHDRTAEADISRAHTDFVANASHELRTPIAAIIGYVETLADSPGAVDEATSARFHATVLREARRMQALVADLMSLSQLEAEKHDAPTESIDLVRLAARVVGEFGASLGHARLDFSRPDAAHHVAGDSRQLEQLVRNLIDNALKYGDNDKPVTIRVGEQDGTALIQVEDRGAGIAPEHLPHLTRRFYRTDPGRSRAGGGTGLGLAIVKHIVERHRARLAIDSELGAGTKVSVRFPLIAAPVEDVS